jgi:hypothetical protein
MSTARSAERGWSASIRQGRFAGSVVRPCCAIRTPGLTIYPAPRRHGRIATRRVPMSQSTAPYVGGAKTGQEPPVLGVGGGLLQVSA